MNNDTSVCIFISALSKVVLVSWCRCTKRKGNTWCFGGFRLTIWKKNIFRKSGEILAQAAQGGAGVTTLEMFKKCREVALWDMVSGMLVMG